MSKNTILNIVISIFALIIIAAILRFRQGVKAKVSGPFDTSLELDASNPQPTPGVTIKGAKSHAGGIRAEDTLTRGAHIEDAEARGDIVATNILLERDARITVNETALLSEPALAGDWNRPEEDEAWSHLQPQP